MVRIDIKNFKEYLYCFVLLTPLMKPAYFSTISIINKGYDYLLYIIFLIVITLVILKKKMFNKKIIPYSLLYIFLLVTTVINKGNIRGALITIITIFTLIGIIELYSSKLLILIKSAYTYLEVYLYINLIGIILKPSGLYSVYSEAYGFSEEHFLSAKNFFVFWMLPALYLGLILYNKKKINKRFILFIGLMLFNQLFFGSGTGKVMIIIFIILFLIPYKNIYNSRLFIIVGVILNIIIIRGTQLPIFSEITELLGKDTTFSNRDTIWANAISAIFENFWTGLGVVDTDNIVYILGVFPGFIWLGATHAHNQFLQISLQEGIIGIIFLGIHLIIISSIIQNNIEEKVYQVCSMFLLIYFITGVTEVFSFQFFNIMLILPIYLQNMVKGEKINE